MCSRYVDDCLKLGFDVAHLHDRVDFLIEAEHSAIQKMHLDSTILPENDVNDMGKIAVDAVVGDNAEVHSSMAGQQPKGIDGDIQRGGDRSSHCLDIGIQIKSYRQFLLIHSKKMKSCGHWEARSMISLVSSRMLDTLLRL